MYSAMIETMRTDALNDLYAGYVTPLDREILADIPLPSDMVDPFASQEVDPLSVMNLTYVSLSGWIAEAKKEKYYSERFVQLSRLVMKGVTTMGRGLVTLHQRGEDLSAAPMQIDDLISVGSYHFRKSYLGVVQFSARHPEIGERLLVNQLGWSTTLLRLYKTKEKLDKKSVSGARIGDQGSRLNEEGRTLPNEEGSIQNEELPSDSECGIRNTELPSDSGCEISNAALDDCPALNAVSALFEPAAFSAQRALTSLEGNKKSEIRNKKSNSGDRDQVSGVNSQGPAASLNEEERSKNEEERIEAHGGEAPARNLMCEAHSLPGSVSRCHPAAAKPAQGTVTSDALLLPADEESESVISGQGTVVSLNEEERSKNEESVTEIQNAENPLNEEEKKKEEGLPEEKDNNSSFFIHNSSLEDDSSLDQLPPYLEILKNVMERSDGSEDGVLTFTFDEMRFLAEDPGFREVYPQSAEKYRNMLAQYAVENGEDSS